ncbi:CPBP family intramembrane glutamic endopeptidase [Cellulosimicrobium cellulans]|uniref:CPBP family intramembrane glutamic endopeptidase n=1 Tax=Cellulosimicrobium cellulans TaxID=1710 RepID=UPI001483155A|nr:CPBP family intramembrane glutamic endopeptidase [Cellulosimicrobium cellulans]
MTTTSTTLTRPNATWRRISTFAHAALAELVLFIALFLLAAATSITLANSLPGIVPFEDVRALLVIALTLALALVATLVVVELVTLRRHTSAKSDLARAWRHTRVWIRLFANHLGLAPRTRRHAARLLVIGLAAGLLAFAANLALTAVPALAATSSPDARNDAVAGAPPWAAVLYLAIYSPAWEEVWHRGTLLLTVAAVAWWVPSPGMRRALIAVALVASSASFGLAHLDWSVLNAVTATSGGLLYGAAAVMTRSLWPAFVAHTVMNAAVGLAWILT